MWYVYREVEMRMSFWRGKLKERDRLDRGADGK